MRYTYLITDMILILSSNGMNEPYISQQAVSTK